MPRRHPDVFHEAALLLVESARLAARQQVREADNGVQRRPQFVADAGQKLALQTIRALYFLVAGCQFLVQHPEFRGTFRHPALQTGVQPAHLGFRPFPLHGGLAGATFRRASSTPRPAGSLLWT